MIVRKIRYITLFSMILPSVILAQTFTRITTGAIFSDLGDSYGCCWGDFNNDGFLDLFVANAEDQNNLLYINNGDPSPADAGSGQVTFTPVRIGDIVNDGGDSRGCTLGDFDNDGDLDLFVANKWNKEVDFLYDNDGDPDGSGQVSFHQIETGPIVNRKEKSHSGSWGDFDNDGLLDLIVGMGSGNCLFRNNLRRFHGLKIEKIRKKNDLQAWLRFSENDLLVILMP